MKNERRKFSAVFKAKIAVEAIKEQLTLGELGQKHELHQKANGYLRKRNWANTEAVFEHNMQAKG